MPLPIPDPGAADAPVVHPAAAAGAVVEAHGERIEQLMRRLECLRRRLRQPSCCPRCRLAMAERVSWLHGAIFAISAELDCGY